jgi:5-(carboxyamino)imidazole ribonucleotide synthase
MRAQPTLRFAISILSAKRPQLREKLREFREAQTQSSRSDASVTRPILPGATIGVLGSGQLGRMFAMAARRMGYRVHTFSPETDTPTGQIADVEITASYDDLDAVRRFARDVDVTTFEFENIPARTVEAVSEYVAVRPGGIVLHTTQHRLREKNFLRVNGFPVTPFHHVNSIENLREGLRILGVPPC